MTEILIRRDMKCFEYINTFVYFMSFTGFSKYSYGILFAENKENCIQKCDMKAKLGNGLSKGFTLLGSEISNKALIFPRYQLFLEYFDKNEIQL